MQNCRKILILGGRYANPLYANSVCRQNLAEFLVKEGHDVYILASGYEYGGEEDTINGVWVRKIYGDHFGELLQRENRGQTHIGKLSFAFKRCWHNLKALALYPCSSDQDYKQLFKHSKDIIDRFHIDTLIAMYRPYDCIKVALMLKKEYGSDLKVVTYHLDLMSEHLNANSFVVKLKQRRIGQAFRKELSSVDKVLLPGSAPFIDEEKVEYVDFPLYIPEDSGECLGDKKTYFNEDKINIAIVGTLDNINRNPNYICHLVDQIPTIKGKWVELHIWGAQKDVDYSQFKRTIYHGMVDVKEVHDILGACDFLLNIGNKLTATMIPSKIFQMFAAKKPIIFNVSSRQDKSIPYFKKYGYTCFVEEYDHQEKEDLDRIISFIEKNYQAKLEVDDQTFEKSTPRYICQKILEA